MIRALQRLIPPLGAAALAAASLAAPEKAHAMCSVLSHPPCTPYFGSVLRRRPFTPYSCGVSGGPCSPEVVLRVGNVPVLKVAVTEALTNSLAESGTPALVLCHISHVYPTGASLYFTVVAGQRGNPIEQWRKAKAAASDAMMRTGATITHHHAVGADHRPWMRDEIGDLGVTILRAVKDTLDPAGILNPGKLIP